MPNQEPNLTEPIKTRFTPSGGNMAKSDGTVIDLAWVMEVLREAALHTVDVGRKHLHTQDHKDKTVEEGMCYSASVANVRTNGQTLILTLTTGATALCLHDVRIGSTGNYIEFEFFEVSTFTAGTGTGITFQNRNRNRSNNSGCILYQDPTIVTDGTRLEVFYLNQGKQGIMSDYRLKPNTTYQFKITNRQTAGNNEVDINIEGHNC